MGIVCVRLFCYLGYLVLLLSVFLLCYFFYGFLLLSTFANSFFFCSFHEFSWTLFNWELEVVGNMGEKEKLLYVVGMLVYCS